MYSSPHRAADGVALSSLLTRRPPLSKLLEIAQALTETLAAAAGLGALLAEMLRLKPDDGQRLAAAIGTRTGGNPFDTVELVNGLRHEGALSLRSEGWSWDEGLLFARTGCSRPPTAGSTTRAVLPYT